MLKRLAIVLTILLGTAAQIAHACPWCADRYESRNLISTEEIPAAAPPKPFGGSYRIVLRDLVERAEWTEISSEKKYETLYGKDKHGMSVFSATVSCQ